VEQTVVASYAVLGKVYPVAASEMPGMLDELVGSRVTPGYCAHAAFVACDGRNNIHPLALWEVQPPASMLLIERHMLLPFAILQPISTSE
jgi:hypothetical protein